MKTLSSKHMAYIHYRALGKPCAVAARAAGFKAGYAKNANIKLELNPLIKAELDKVRAELGERTKYTLERAIEELDYRIERADAAEQHTAVSSMLRDKLKIHGYLVEKLQLDTGPDLAAALAAAQARVAPRRIAANFIDVQPVPVEPDPVDPFS